MWWEALKSVGSVAGLLTFCWKVWEAWDASRNRLRIRTTMLAAGRLDLAISYSAKSEHSALRLTLAVLAPRGARVALMPPAPELWSFEQLAEVMIARENPLRSANRSMTLSPSVTGLYGAQAELFLGPRGGSSALVWITIRSVAGGFRTSRLIKVAGNDDGSDWPENF